MLEEGFDGADQKSGRLVTLTRVGSRSLGDKIEEIDLGADHECRIADFQKRNVSMQMIRKR